MHELEKYSPTPPQLGPPLPGILKAYWPWVKQPPEAPKPRTAETPSGPSDGYFEATDSLIEASMKRHREEQAAKGLVPFYYE